MHPNLVFHHDPNPVEPEAARLLRYGTREYFRVSSRQLTVYPLKPDETNYEDIFSAAGWLIYNAAQQRYAAGDVKDYAPEYRIQWEVAGSWMKDPASPYEYNDEGEEKIEGILNAWHNATIVGKMELAGAVMATSTCVFITHNWCLTRSGSIYRLGQKV